MAAKPTTDAAVQSDATTNVFMLNSGFGPTRRAMENVVAIDWFRSEPVGNSRLPMTLASDYRRILLTIRANE